MINRLNLTDIKTRNILLQHLGVLLIGILIFFVEKLEVANLFWEKLILILVSLGKSVYFVEHSFRKIEEASVNNISYNKFLSIILLNIMLIVVSFGVDFMCMLQIDPNSFRGMANTGFIDTAFDAFYYSLVSFTTVAYGDIIPLTKSARTITILEVVVAYVTTIIIISNFVQIKDSMEKK